MSEIKMNCWEYKKCGREPNGSKSIELGVCPVPLERSLNETHSGRNAGRACWVVGGSLCGGAVQGTFASKYKNCRECDFYLKVKNEEPRFHLMAVLVHKIRA
ncbi:MAG: hypothetical protein INQ03_20555 [Candidatus Heimdallarchaeota archaeon]|nr:hypothetical protein [Candidatus Heimdallarchaeota archaeon]